MTTALLAGTLAVSVQAQTAFAQDAPPPPPPPAEAAPPPPPPVETPAPAPAAAPAAPAPTPAPTVSAEVNKVQHKKMDPPAIWFRLDNRVQSKDPADAKKLNGFVMGSEVDVLFSGEVHEYVAWQADFVATFGNQSAGQPITGSANVLDLIGKFNLHDAFNIWVGRMLVPSDRSNFSGPWFMSAWNYPGFYPAPVLGGGPVGPRQGPFGRNDGATLWGQFLGGYVKYYAGAFDLHDIKEKALFSGRLNLSLLNPEPGFYHSSTYYGGKDIVALGISGQYKKDGSAPPSMLPAGTIAPPVEDYSEISADLLAEKKFGDAGTGTFEGAFYKFNGKNEPVKNDFYVLASYLIPGQVWIGRFQPLVRLQQAKAQGGGTWRMIDGAVSYVVDEYAMRVALNYQNADIAGTKANSVTIGIQIQK